MSDAVAHWDEVEPRVIARGDLQGRRRRLGPTAGCDQVGLSRYDLEPGQRPMPLHAHAEEEEIDVVLSGSGVTTDGERAWAIAAGDTVVHRAGGPAHTFVAGPEGMEILVFGTGSDTHLTWLPRAGAMWIGPRWLPLDGPNPFVAEAQAATMAVPDPEPARAAHVMGPDQVAAVPQRLSDVDIERRWMGRAAGSRRSGLTHSVVAPGARSSLPHCHSGDEELFVVLAGTGALELHDHDAGLISSHAVRAGSLVARPAGTGVAHSFTAGPEPLTLLAFSRDSPGDMCFYPRSQKVALRGLGVIVAVDRLTHADGEPASPGS